MALDKTTFFHEATIRICGSLDIEKAMWRLLRYLKNYMPITGLNLHLFESDMTILRSIAQATPYENEKFDDLFPVPDNIKLELDRGWLETQDVIIVNQPELDPVIKTMTEIVGEPNRSFMVMRLEIEGNKIGALNIYVDGKDKYKKEHADLLAMLHDPIAIALSNAVRHQDVLTIKENLADDNLFLHQEIQRLTGDEIIGKDSGLKEVMTRVDQVAPLNSPVLIMGETGTGKEMIANAIHNASTRKNCPFIKVNCGAIPETLIDSELFGHEKGAFTGAISQKRGRFERAHQGTILLDEIGELPLTAQVRLLRVIQSKEIERVGGTSPISIDIRIIAATHRDIEQMVSQNQFREDLWFRLNVFPIRIAPLRERTEDIPELIAYALKRKANELNLKTIPDIETADLERLKTYPWRGNVRELQNIVEHALIQSQDQKKNRPLIFDLPVKEQSSRPASVSFDHGDKQLTLDEVIVMHIQNTLKQAKGKIHGPGGAAEILGINPNTLRYKMDKLGIPFKKQKKKQHM